MVLAEASQMVDTETLRFDGILDTIAEETGVRRDELYGDTEFADLGIDEILAGSITSRIAEKTGIRLFASTLNDYPTVDSLRTYLQELVKSSLETTDQETSIPSSSAPAKPLSILLQGNAALARTTIFLLPDGSGSGAAYLRLPAIDPSVCLIGMNSPFLNAGKGGSFSVEGISAMWADEIRRRQPEGPYVLGGWSAGGYYSFEVAKYLVQKGQRVQKLVLIDSPCRLEYEELPMEVVHYLSKHNLMGNWSGKKPPAWMIDHFEMSIKAISEYVPTPIMPPGLAEVCIIWARSGVLDCADASRTGLNLDVKVTQMLLQRPNNDGPLGWDRLFPGTKISLTSMPGNHFTIVHPPNCKFLSSLLKDITQQQGLNKECNWRKI